MHATPLTPGEYVWGKFAAVLACTLGVLAIHLLAMIFFFHVLPGDAEQGHPRAVSRSELPPAGAGVLAADDRLPGGNSLAIGEWTRRPILVFLLPLALVMVDLFFLWSWSPSWLDPRINRVLMLVDPGGFRWLNETWLKVDRGVSFYNTAAIPLDRAFLVSRLVFVVLGLGAVALSREALREHACAGTRREPAGRARARLAGEPVSSAIPHQPLASLGMAATAAGSDLRAPGRLPGSSLPSLRRVPASTSSSP